MLAKQITKMFRFYLFVVLFVCSVWKSTSEENEKSARWCTISQAEFRKCESMTAKFAENNLTVPAIQCVEEPTVEECLIAIREGQADLITLDGGDVFRAGKVFGMKPIMKEIYTSGSTGYYGIAVTKANTDVSLTNLKGARTCHTGVGRTAGWNIPVGYLLRSGQMKSAGCKEHAKSASQFFSSSCAPGALLADNNPYRDNLTNLCGICAGDCGRDPDTEPYNGYSGALRCLIEGMGEVAFIKPATIEANIGENAPDWATGITTADLRLLCKDGTRAAIEDADQCHISKGVSHSVMTSGSTPTEDVQAYQRLLLAALELFSNDDNPDFTMFDSSAWGGRNLIFKDYTATMEALPDQTYDEYLGGYGESFEGLHKCPDNTVRICTISEQEQQKCREMRDAFLKEGLTPEISCFPTTSHADCIDSIAAGFADIVTLDGGDIYRAGKDHGLIPILGEVYSETKSTTSYWAVAVVKKGTTFSIRELEGKRSCHTGIMKTSGWVMPVGFLAGEGYLDLSETDDGACDITRAVGMFFNSSCVPGAKSAKYDVYGSNPESLCKNCIGKFENKCARNSHEPYYDYYGAFRCLVEDAGDVAFVKHSTVRDNTLPRGDKDWNRRLRQRNFEILCPDGTRTNPWKFGKCNLGKVPSHAVVTSGDKSNEEIANIINLFLNATERFKNETGDGFKIFDSSGFTKDGKPFHYLDSDGQLGKNLIFKDSTVKLKEVRPSKRTYNKWLGQQYLNALEKVKC